LGRSNSTTPSALAPGSSRVVLKRKSRISSWSAVILAPFFLFFLLLLALAGNLYLRRYDFYCVIRGVQDRIADSYLVLLLPHIRERCLDLLVLPLAPVWRIDPLLLLVLQFQSRRRSIFGGRRTVWTSRGSACWGYGRTGIGAGRLRRDFTHQKALRRFVVQQEIDRGRSACGPVVNQLKRNMLSGTGGDQQI
jgi:hypothetical protein